MNAVVVGWSFYKRDNHIVVLTSPVSFNEREDSEQYPHPEV